MEIFPENINYTLERNVVSQRISSSSQRRWQQRRQSLHRPFYTFDLDSANLNRNQTEELNNFYIAHEYQTGNDADSFLLTDPEDNARTAEIVGVGDGTQKEFTLKATYTYGSNSITIPQGHIKETTETIYIDGTAVAEEDYTISYSTGVVIFDSAPGDDSQITADYEFYRKCIFQEENLIYDIQNPVTRDASYLIVEVPG